MANLDEHGRRCGGRSPATDVLNGKPTGAVRASFGWKSDADDVEILVTTIRRYFVRGQSKRLPKSSIYRPPTEEFTIKSIHLYPIKSAAPLEATSWKMGPVGLLFDRSVERGLPLSRLSPPRYEADRPGATLQSRLISLLVFFPLER